MHEQVGDKVGLAASYNNIGLINANRRELEKALSWFEQSRTILEAIGDRANLPTLLHNMASTASAKEEWQRALELFIRSRDLQAMMALEDNVRKLEEMIGQVRSLMASG